MRKKSQQIYAVQKHPYTNQVYILKVVPVPQNGDACFGCVFRPAGTQKCVEGRNSLGSCRPKKAMEDHTFPVWQVKLI